NLTRVCLVPLLQLCFWHLIVVACCVSAPRPHYRVHINSWSQRADQDLNMRIRPPGSINGFTKLAMPLRFLTAQADCCLTYPAWGVVHALRSVPAYRASS